MTLRILISTQETIYERKGSPGGSLPLFLYADFIATEFNLKVDIYDPLYNSQNYINNLNFNIVDEVNINNYDFIINHYFYLIVLKILKFKYDINSNFFRSIAYFFKKTVQESPAFGLK